MEAINYRLNGEVMTLFHFAPAYKKLEKTYFRLPKKEELGTKLITYVKNPNGVGYRKEAEVEIPENRVIARNDYIVGYDENGNAIYNLWTKPFKEVIESYGMKAFDSLTTDFQSYNQMVPIKLLELTPKIMKMLGLEGENELPIEVTWSKEPMIALVGDFLTQNGYSISQLDVKLQYERLT